MRIDLRTAEYLHAVLAALADGRHLATRSDCPECRQPVDPLHDEIHLFTVLPDGTVAVLVGCEGYWLTDPRRVGIDSPGWQCDPSMPGATLDGEVVITADRPALTAWDLLGIAAGGQSSEETARQMRHRNEPRPWCEQCGNHPADDLELVLCNACIAYNVSRCS